MCVDYRDLKRASPIHKEYHLPHIDVLVDNTSGNGMYSGDVLVDNTVGNGMYSWAVS